MLPSWAELNVHHALFDRICGNLGLVPFTPDLTQPKYDRLRRWASVLAKWKLRQYQKRQPRDLRFLQTIGINFGHPLNEWMIATGPDGVPRIDESLHNKIETAILTILVERRLFRSHKIGLVLGGDEAYTEGSIAAQLACRYGVPTAFLKGGVNLRAHAFDAQRLSAVPIRRTPPQPTAKDAALLQQAEAMLGDRIAGRRENLHYMPAQDPAEADEVEKIPRGCVCLFLHDYFDAPGIYGENLFASHVQWVEYTVAELCGLGAAVVIKRHPNERPMNVQINERLRHQFSDQVFWADAAASIGDFRSRGCRAIVTVYGTVIPEATYAGLPVIAAGLSPYHAFDLCHRAATIDGYRRLLQSAVSADGLPAKDPQAAVLAEATQRLGLASTASAVPVPVYDDITTEAWTELYPNQPPPKHSYDRRSVYLTDPAAKTLLHNAIADRNMAAELKIAANQLSTTP